MSLLLRVVLICTISIAESQFPSSCSSSEYGDIRLYNTHTNDNEDGALQLCYNGTWYSVCDSNWDCSDGNVACYQLGYDKARQVVHNSDNYFGYWSHIHNYYYSCSGNEHSLGSCYSHHTYCSPSSDAAGVRCVQAWDSSCSLNGALRLVGGENSHEGVLEYCYYGKWSPFCYLDDEEASVACKQMGYSQYVAFLSPGEYLWNINTTYTGSLFDHFSCSTYGTESSLSSCTFSSTNSLSSCAVSCTHPRAIRCYETENNCIDGQARLVNGSIAQTGRVEVCVDGVWGSVCDVGWTKSDAFVVCKQLGYVTSEPFIYTDSKYGKGDGPIVYSTVNCYGWEKTLSECTKTNYLYFTCSDTAGVLCPDDCVEGEVRLVGGEADSEGTIEVCLNSVWGLITDAGWDQNDAHVVCRQLNLPIDGALPLLNSYYGKPDRAIHYSYILCNGNEQLITSCNKIIHSLEEGRQIYNEADVAGVACDPASPNNFTSSIMPPKSSPSDQPHQSSLSRASILSVVSIILFCLFFIVILFLCIGLVIYCKRKYIKKVKLGRRLPIAMSNIFGEEYSSLHSSDEEISEKKEKDEELHTTGDNPDNSYQDDPTFKEDDSEHIYEYAQPQS